MYTTHPPAVSSICLALAVAFSLPCLCNNLYSLRSIPTIAGDLIASAGCHNVAMFVCCRDYRAPSLCLLYVFSLCLFFHEAFDLISQLQLGLQNHYHLGTVKAEIYRSTASADGFHTKSLRCKQQSLDFYLKSDFRSDHHYQLW